MNVCTFVLIYKIIKVVMMFHYKCMECPPLNTKIKPNTLKEETIQLKSKINNVMQNHLKYIKTRDII